MINHNDQVERYNSYIAIIYSVIVDGGGSDRLLTFGFVVVFVRHLFKRQAAIKGKTATTMSDNFIFVEEVYLDSIACVTLSQRAMASSAIVVHWGDNLSHPTIFHRV